MTARQRGRIGERLVCRYITNSLGMKVVEQNFTVRGGEIDIIAKDGDTLSFIEVKTRKANPLVSGEEAISPDKRAHIIKAASVYLNRLNEAPKCRFDVAVVTVSGADARVVYYKGAFDASR